VGTNGFFSSRTRETCCYLLLTETNIAILLDAGSGVARLIEPEIKDKLSSIEVLHVFLSHYHLDHVIGLSYLPGVWSGKKLIVYAPNQPLVRTEAVFALNRLLNPPLYALRINDLPLEVTPVSESGIELAGTRIYFRAQRHPGGSVGIRIDDTLAYITDTFPDPQTVVFVRGCQLLLHEVWLTDKEAETAVGTDGTSEKNKHSWASAVVKLAAEATVKCLAPIHHAPWRSNTDIEKIVSRMKRESKIKVVLLKECQEYEIEELCG